MRSNRHVDGAGSSDAGPGITAVCVRTILQQSSDWLVGCLVGWPKKWERKTNENLRVRLTNRLEDNKPVVSASRQNKIGSV